jgi:NAD(P)H dehydrogenase (quinone)
MLMKLFYEIENIESRAVLPMPSLEDFDEQFRPKPAKTSSI